MENESFFKGLMTVIYNDKRTIEKIINPQKNLLLRFDPNELIGKSISELEKISNLDDKNSIRTIAKYVISTDKNKTYYFKYPIELSNKKKVDAICMSEQHDDGNIYVNVFQTNQYCITDVKEIFKNFIFDSCIYRSPIGLSISYINKFKEKRYLIFNDAIRKIYEKEDITSSVNWDVDEENRTDSLALKNSSYTYDQRLYDNNGIINKWITTTKQVVRCKEDGYFIISTTTDVTSLCDKYSLVSELKLYSSLYNSIPLSVAVYDVDGILRSVNSKYIKLFYADFHKIIDKQNIKTDKYVPAWALTKLLNGESISYNNVYEITKPFNDITKKPEIDVRLLSVNIIPIKDVHHNIIGYSQMFDDITERSIDKHLLDVLHKHLPIGVILYDKDGNLLNVNAKNREIMGIPLSVSLDDVNLFNEPNLPYEYISKLKNGEDVSFDLDYDFGTIEGYFETSHKYIKKLRIIIVVVKNNGLIDGYLLMNQDMTSIKENETQLEENNKKIDIALKNSGIIFWEYRCDEKYFRSNDYGIFLNKKRYKTIDDYTNVIIPSYRSKFENIKHIIDNRINKSFCEEGVFVNQETNEKRNILFCGEPYMLDSSGKAISYVGYRKDITEEKKLYDNMKAINSENKTILDNIDFGLAYIDNDYNIKWSNAELLKTDVINQFKLYKSGNTCYKVVFNRETPCEHCVIKDAISCGHKVTHSDVKIGDKYLEICAIPIEKSSSSKSGYLLKVSDITQSHILGIELKEKKDELANINNFLRKSIMSLPIGISIKDADTGTYITVNDTFSKICGMDNSNIDGRKAKDIFDNQIAELIESNDEITKKLNEQKHLYKCNYIHAQENIPLEVHEVLINIDKNKKYIISAIIDMTEKIKTIKELNIAKEHAEESDRLKSSFLANMSHEIRTPLNAIVGFSEIIASNDNKAENDEYLQIIQRNNQILLRLINDILDLSKIEAGVIKLRNKEFDLTELDNNFKAFYNCNKLNSEVEFITDLPYSKCIVNLDEERFTQVCNNFISNAIKYTNKGFIKYGYSYEDGGIKIYVKDTGMGIPKASQSRLFTRFGKLNDNIQGNGLGLTICKAILEIQNGKIGFESEENKGSTFWAWFPTNVEIQDRNHNKNITHIANKEEKIAFTANSNSEKGKSNIRVLVAEDNDSNYILLKRLLSNYILVRAVNGIEAVELAKTDSFGLILMDIKMPKMNGIEATKKIREFNKEIIIIALTANAFDSDLKIEKEAGCDDVITKPITSQGKEYLFNLINSLE